MLDYSQIFLSILNEHDWLVVCMVCMFAWQEQQLARSAAAAATAADLSSNYNMSTRTMIA